MTLFHIHCSGNSVVESEAIVILCIDVCGMFLGVLVKKEVQNKVV